MGSPFDDWNAVAGAAYYMGAESLWEPIWLLVSIGCCIAALVSGYRHEYDAYRRAQNGEGNNPPG
jgi:hypothetical protein